MPKQFHPRVRERAVRVTLDRLSEYPSVYAACKALAPKLGVGPESLRRWVVQAQVDAGEKTGPSSDELEEIKRHGLRCVERVQRDPQTGVDFLREGARPSRPLICRFIDEMRAEGYAVESICAVLREQGVQVAARTYRAWKKRLPALRTIEDARITDAFRALKVPDAKGRPLARDYLRTAENDAVAAP